MKPPPCLLSRSAEKELSLPLLENSAGTIAGVRSPLLLEVAAGLLPNRFRDRRCFGLAVLSSVRLSFSCCMLQLESLRLLRKQVEPSCWLPSLRVEAKGTL
ncbi:uncharacterized protein LOC110268901 isoform X1 [Arachis ipaensis]|uniref:uncharacterized protein LOC110268901 isoform X1 n=1 Tax=Arachis ipaensis TaxID=130454 RepID=UPI000A2B0F18|nr:uncharacterized protein LOC110268901 isoform X1 [Arachis ipaensis]